MNNEIKEKIPFNVRDVLEDINSNILWNYITNLKRENERLKDSRDWWQDRFFGQQEYDDSYRITAIEYKKRIDKVIEYLNARLEEYRNSGLSKKYINYGHYYKIIIDLLHILQNGSDEE